MTHKCPDGKYSKLTRDASVPVGVPARHTCPACGWTMAGQEIIDRTMAVLNDPKVRAALAR
jgi:hypothetical protein